MSDADSPGRYEVHCPFCDAGHRCGEALLGKHAKCMKCGRDFRVPQFRAVESAHDTPLADGRTVADPPVCPPIEDFAPVRPRRVYKRTKNKRPNPYATLILVASIVGVAVGCLVLLVAWTAFANGTARGTGYGDGSSQASDLVVGLFGLVVLVAFLVLGIVVYFVPTAIAYYRKHRFIGPIFVLNLAGGWSVLGWFAALAWAVWPSDTLITDALTHDPTGLSARNVGHAAGEIRNAYDNVRRAD